MIGEMTGHGKRMAVQDRDSMSGFPEVMASALRLSGVQVKVQKGGARETGISLVRVSVHIKNC